MIGPRHPPPNPTLREAVRCPLLDGDLEQWVRCCTCRFLPLARRVAGDDDVAHDALQQSWVIVLEKLHQYRGGVPACGWVGAIVRHEALHGATARGRELPLDAVGGEAGSSAGRTARAGDVWEAPEVSAYARELTRLLLEVIDELPPTFREVVRLRDLEDRPPEEVARRLHISSRNVAVRLHRAHKLLRPRLLRRIAGVEAGRSTRRNL
ncbi:MAG: RNA polymerase sigma factor [Acidobacteria bacterium]|nr:RNA polymerase sigma factor [Acidobacteriota bacterium]